MSSSQRNKIPENIIILDDSSDEEDVPNNNKSLPTLTPSQIAPHAPPTPLQTPGAQTVPHAPPTGVETPGSTLPAVRSIDSRSFWKAGSYEEIKFARPALLAGNFIKLNYICVLYNLFSFFVFLYI